MRTSWTPESWKGYAASQQPEYDDPAELQEVLAVLRRLPPLVSSWEIDRLRADMTSAQAGQAWVLQGGDCAESFDDCQAESIASKIKSYCRCRWC